MNEIGISPARQRPVVGLDEAERQLSELTGKAISLPDGATVHAGPRDCPACSSTDLMWGCDERQQRVESEIHELVWDDVAWMADSYVCRTCWAGWIEPDEPLAITWVRPYWSV